MILKFNSLCLVLGEMEMRLSFLFREFSLILCAFIVQESVGLSLQSLSIASLIIPSKVKTPDLNLFDEEQQRFMLLQSDIALSPTSFHSQAPHPSIRAPNVHIRHPTKKKMHGPSSVSPHNNRYIWKKFHQIAPEPYHQLPPSSYTRKGPVITTPSPSPSASASSKTGNLPLPAIPPKRLNGPSPSPAVSSVSSSMENNKNTLPPLPSLILPPPPPNQGCISLTCSEPLTYTPPGAPCGCVYPIQVRLLFRVSLYTFFPLVSELSKEISVILSLNRSQVRIMGADSADQERTNVFINLLPLDVKFNASTTFSIYTKFWKREVSIPSSTFGAYDVIYVRYPGLPPSPPRSSYPATIGPYPGGSNDDEPIKPLGVDVPKRKKNETGKNMVIVIVLSSVTAFIVFMGCTLIFLSKMGCCSCLYRKALHNSIHSEGKPSGGERLLTIRSKASSNSMSLSSSLLACTGTAKVFTFDEIERATNSFNGSRILGEGGFGLVYGGILDDGREVAVKVLKRYDQQGGREFLAEVEMLGRLHHRNLVKLVGICAEDQCRCLVYDLVPNGSVESHLHGVDKEKAPLDWSARMKIALGAARGLAYLHEDSSPRVIHRDFKSSNILLENDFTPKVSDFGLARAAMDEGNKHISTHVMGTFGYLAPEYAMTGHLLVKSDVYSYGVVLLELLTGRKPVDLSQRPGQENLVSWARPLLTTTEGLEMIIDPSLKSDVPLESVARVSAIASMCVQPEVSHRPFMGEVVQALKLVCDEFDETRERISRTCSRDDLSIDMERLSNELEKRDSTFDTKVGLSGVDLKGASVGFGGGESESFRRQFNSAPLKMGRKRRFWQRLGGLSRGSMSEHEFSTNFQL